MKSLPPGPRLPRALQVYRWLRHPVEFLEACARRYGDVFTLRFPNSPPLVAFSDPEAVKEMFTADPDVLHAGEANVILEPLMGQNSLLLIDGERHRRERRLMTPPFRGDRMKAYGGVMRDAANRSIDTWPVGRIFSIHEKTQSITLDIIFRAIFGMEDSPRLTTLRDGLVRGLTIGSNPIYLIPFFRRNLGPLTSWPEIARMLRESDAILYEEFARRRDEETSGRDDVLSMLLQARDEEGRAMSDQELRDQMVTLMVAGHETTATALAWAVHHMLENPGIHARLRDEIREAGGGGPVDAGGAGRLEYLDAFIKETMRLNPIIPFVARLAKRPVKIGGHEIPEGVVVAPCIYLTQRRPDVWPDPLRFDPDRFIGARPNPYTYFPFGGGTRLCLGAAFATYEMKIVMAEIIRRTQLKPAPGRAVRIVRRSITFAPTDGMPVLMDAPPG